MKRKILQKYSDRHLKGFGVKRFDACCGEAQTLMYAISADQTQRTPYAPPLKENVGSTINATPVSCGLASEL